MALPLRGNGTFGSVFSEGHHAGAVGRSQLSLGALSLRDFLPDLTFFGGNFRLLWPSALASDPGSLKTYLGIKISCHQINDLRLHLSFLSKKPPNLCEFLKDHWSHRSGVQAQADKHRLSGVLGFKKCGGLEESSLLPEVKHRKIQNPDSWECPRGADP